jgi:hypothetical protein
MAAPSATESIDRYAGQSRASLIAGSEEAYVFDAGSDTFFLPFVSKAFEVSADCTLSVVLNSGQTITWSCKAGVQYLLRVKQLKQTGTTLGGASVLFYC